MTGGAAGIRPPAGGTSGATAVIPLDPAISSRQVSVPDLPGVPLVLQRRVVTFGPFESFAVVAALRLGLPAATPVRPMQYVIRGSRDGVDEFAV